MQGMLFVLMNDQMIPINHGVIEKKITDTDYLCTFLGSKVAVSRVVNLEELRQYNLFSTYKALRDFTDQYAPENPENDEKEEKE